MRKRGKEAYFAYCRIKELRATEKELSEQRADLQTEMEQLLEQAKTEKRAMTEEEQTKFDELEKQIKAIDNTLAAEERARKTEYREKARRRTKAGATGRKSFLPIIFGEL